jgi:DNA-binding beta-propeller fold protein YncE
MMETVLRRSAIVMLIALAAGCGYDSNGPESYDAPSVPDANEGLWIASGIDPAILRLAPSQLLSNGRQIPSTTVTTSSASLLTISGIAFDAAGTMWIASADDSLVLAFSPEILATSGLSVASMVIEPTDRSLRAPAGIAFDRLQRLWVANFETGTLVRFDPGQLAFGGAQTPAVTITGLLRPTALAFDPSGALWVANSQSNTLVKFSPAQLETSGFPRPEVVLSASEGSLSNPFALAFDAAGKLWVANIGTAAIVAFTPDVLAATGSPAPAIAIGSLGAGSFEIPVGLAFDAEGNLWVVGGDDAVYKFAQSTLGVAGKPAPAAQLFLSGHTLLSGIALWPTPPGLPIN